jgi:hypothetical protein
MHTAVFSRLANVLLEDFRNLVRALLGVPFLTALVINISDAKACCVALGPFEVAVSILLAQSSPNVRV